MSDSAIFSSAPQRGRHSNQLTGMFSMDLDENSISNSKNLDLIVATAMLCDAFLIFFRINSALFFFLRYVYF